MLLHKGNEEFLDLASLGGANPTSIVEYTIESPKYWKINDSTPSQNVLQQFLGVGTWGPQPKVNKLKAQQVEAGTQPLVLQGVV